MNATFTAPVTALCCLGAALLLAPTVQAKPTPHRAAPARKAAPAPAPAAPSPAVALVRQYLAARADGQEDKAYALLSPNTQALFPAVRRAQIAAALTGPDAAHALPPAALPVMALLVDIHDTLHFKFRALGPSPDDPAIVLVRAYQVGTPLSTIRTLQIVTAPDPDADGALRVDGEKTALLAAPEMRQDRDKAWQAMSQSNLKQLSLGIIQYTQDHDETLPHADKWVDEILPYVKNEAAFRDPAAPDLKWGYAFNRALSGVTLADLDEPALTVVLFESETGQKNAADTGSSLPLPGRHNGGTDYALADGHIKWEADGTKPSFLLTGK